MRCLLLILAVVTLAGCTRGKASEPELLAANVSHLADQRAQTADRWLQTLVERREAGEPLTPEFISRLIEAAKAKAIAKADAAHDRGEALAAYTTYRDFCGDLLDRVRRQPEVPPQYVTTQLRYAMADAEWRMGQYQSP